MDEVHWDDDLAEWAEENDRQDPGIGNVLSS